MTKLISKSEVETKKAAQNLAKKLKGGEIVALIGDLGSGKTIFVKGLARGLGVKNIITSPTFVLMKIYKLKVKSLKFKVLNLVHIDAYRLKNGEELAAIGALDYFNDKNTITVIEWADRVKKFLPKRAIKIHFKVLKESQREINIW